MSPTAVKIFSALRRQMNGHITGAMELCGVQYGMNYGVSIPTIKDICAFYGPDHALAGELWRQEVRELRLAAIFIEDPVQVTLEQMILWSQKWSTLELAEQCAMQLFYKADDHLLLARHWVQTGNVLQKKAAYLIIGKSASGHVMDELQPFITAEASAYCLREIYKSCPLLRGQILSLAENVADLKWQIEALDY
ncbi:MAG: DNA alkylation repair protein [Mucinivorans sp.]